MHDQAGLLRQMRWGIGLAWVLAVTPLMVAQPESSACWMGFYGAALGLAPEGLPEQSEYVDEVTATVVDPTRLATLGVPGARRGEQVTLISHDNGYWTVQLAGAGRSVNVPLAYRLRFGVEPDKELPDGQVPAKIVGRVVQAEILCQYGFRTAESARRFTLEFVDGGWWLTLEPGGEKQLVPF